jgi:hypothetical protein
LARDNLGKRKSVPDSSFLFCGEKESVAHLFFDCVVAKKAWEMISQVLGVKVGSNYESVASLWLCNKRFDVCNIFTSVIFLELMEVKKLLVLPGCLAG